MSKTTVALLSLTLALSLPVFRVSAQLPANGSRRVLVLYSYARQLPWENKVMAGFDEALNAMPLAERPFLFEESLDASRVGEPCEPDAWRRYLAVKYRDVALDAVITESQQAAALLLSSPELFPGAERYVLHFADSAALGTGTGAERRFSTASDLERALSTVTATYPLAKRIVFVTDKTSVGAARTEQVAGIAPGFPSASIEIWDDYTVPELLERAAALPADAALFYVPVQVDREGRQLVPGVVAELLAASASAPVFSHFDSLLGTGIAGGYMVSGVQLGRLMADIAARGQAAAPASQARYAEATMGYYFDARALDRWAIDEDALPAGSVVLYREPGFLARFWRVVVAVSLLFALETFLIAALYRQSLQRRRAMALLAAERASLEGKVLSRTADLSQEIGERKLAEERAGAMAAEKATLLKELQHRVKNSLGIMASLIGIEAGKARNDDVRATLETLESRVSALALLYDMLYDSGGIDQVPLASYLESVVASAASSLGADARGIRLRCDLASASIDMRRAVSLGLAVNELVTDCLKYAFPEGRTGLVRVSLRLEAGYYVVVVADDGVGLPPGFEPESGHGFGLKLVSLLSRQLGAEFVIESKRGSSFTLRIPA